MHIRPATQADLENVLRIYEGARRFKMCIRDRPGAGIILVETPKQRRLTNVRNQAERPEFRPRGSS